MPRVGAWHADLVVDAAQALAGAVTIAAPGITLVGTVSRGGVYAGVNHVRVVAGADGLRRAAEPKHYTSPTVRLPLVDLCKTAGESIAGSSSTQVLNATILNWTTVRAPIGRIVAALLEQAPAASWRMLPDGTLWVGVETWPASAIDDEATTLLDESPAGGSMVLGATAPSLLPGTVHRGVRIDYAEHTITGDKIRTRLWSSDESTWDRVKGPLLAMAEPYAAPEYRGLYRARLVSQSADLQKCGVIPDDDRLPQMENIPLAHGVPGLSVRVRPGAHLLVGWMNGSPARPFASLWETDASAVKVTMTADDIFMGGETGAERAPMGETLQTYLVKQSGLLSGHIHPGGTIAGNTGPSAMLAPPALVPPTNLLATRAKVR